MRHSEHAPLLSNIEKLTLPILGSVLPFWIPTGDFRQLEATSRKDSLSVVSCSSQSNVSGVSQAEGEGAPGPSLARPTVDRMQPDRSEGRGSPGLQ